MRMKHQLTNHISCIILLAGFYNTPVYGAENAAIPDNSAHIYVNGCRALCDALKILGNQLHCIITYEDPEYTAETTHPIYPGAEMFAPYDKYFEFKYNRGLKDTKLKIIQTMVSKFNRENKVVEFAVRQSTVDKDIYHCEPVKVLYHGKMDKCWSLLGLVISVHKTGTYQECLSEIGNQPPLEHAFNMPMMSEFFMYKTTLRIDNKTTSDCLDILLNRMLTKKSGNRYTWDLGRNTNDYIVLDIKEVPKWNFTNSANITGFDIQTEEPLAFAAHIICREYKCSSLYEDPIILSRYDTWNDKNGKPIVKVDGSIKFDYDRKQSVKETFHKAIEAYNSQAYPCEFEYWIQDGFITIYPTIISGKEKYSDYKITSHLSDISITMPSKPIPLYDCLNQIVQQIAAVSDRKVEMGIIKGISLKELVSCSAEEQPLCEYLNALTNRIGNPICWQLIYNPKTDAYSLNAYPSDAPVTIQ